MSFESRSLKGVCLLLASSLSLSLRAPLELSNFVVTEAQTSPQSTEAPREEPASTGRQVNDEDVSDGSSPQPRSLPAEAQI